MTTDSMPKLEKRKSFSDRPMRRMSFDEKQLAKSKPAPALDPEEAERGKQERRRRSFEQMQFYGGMSGLVKDQICAHSGISEMTEPKEKMDILLILAKQRGMTADKIFKHFDADQDDKITASEFKHGLLKLDPVRFKMSDADITRVVDLFDKDKDGTVDVGEFKAYCYALPDTSWKAEKLRSERRDSAEPATDDAPAPALDAALDPVIVVDQPPAPAPEDSDIIKEAAPPSNQISQKHTQSSRIRLSFSKASPTPGVPSSTAKRSAFK